MGVVYEAEDTELGRFVALKFLPDDLAQGMGEVYRARDEERGHKALVVFPSYQTRTRSFGAK